MYDSLPACFSLWKCTYTSICASVGRGREFAGNVIVAFVSSRLRKGCSKSSIESRDSTTKVEKFNVDIRQMNMSET